MNMINSPLYGFIFTVNGAIFVEDHLSECVVGLFSVKSLRANFEYTKVQLKLIYNFTTVSQFYLSH